MARVTRRDVLKTAGATLAASAVTRLSLVAQSPGLVMRTLSSEPEIIAANVSRIWCFECSSTSDGNGRVAAVAMYSPAAALLQRT